MLDKNLKVGILGLQGGIEEHSKMLSQLEGVNTHNVKTVEDIESIDALIIPGGESTTIGKLLFDFGLADTLKNRIQHGMPTWGTCAGMILMAKKICNHDKTFLDVMDIEVRRNAYGSQLDSFKTKVFAPKIDDKEIPLVFIRAPYVENAWNGVETLIEIDGKIVACRQGHMLATAFHPELTDDISFHKFFIEKLVRGHKPNF